MPNQTTPGQPSPPFDPARFVRLTPRQLRRLYRRIFGQDAQASDLNHLRRRIAWELQARIEGRLPDTARELALTLARHSTLRSRPLPPNSRAARSATGDALTRQQVRCDQAGGHRSTS